MTNPPEQFPRSSRSSLVDGYQREVIRGGPGWFRADTNLMLRALDAGRNSVTVDVVPQATTDRGKNLAGRVDARTLLSTDLPRHKRSHAPPSPPTHRDGAASATGTGRKSPHFRHADPGSPTA